MEKTPLEKRWKKIKTRNEMGALVVVYCVLVGAMGAVLLLSALTTQSIVDSLKDDEYLTDDSLPYRDMVNATYTYPVADIDEMAEGQNWMLAMGAVLAAGAIVVPFAMFLVWTPKKEIHEAMCNGDGEKKYCPECGLKFPKEKD